MKQLIAGALVAFLTVSPFAQAQTMEVQGTAGSKIKTTIVAEFDQPWAMTFLPDKTLLVTTKPGKMFRVHMDGTKHRVEGVPDVAVGGQGGLGDVVIHPDFSNNNWIYLSYIVIGEASKRGAIVVRAKLGLNERGGGTLSDLTTIWKQYPKTSGRGHFSHRLAFGPGNGAHQGKLLITSGDRQLQSPAQDMALGLGKIIRLNDDGSVPADNPWADGSKGEPARTFWSLGHRNLLGIAFDLDGKLWATEMGPRHGDELNLIEKGRNYGWPIVSEGKHYSGQNIPNHDTRPEFYAPKTYWVPSIAPSGLVIYSGKSFPKWQGNAFIGGLVSRALIRVELIDDTAREVERFKWEKRVREVEQGPIGDLWVLEDKQGARLLKLSQSQ